MKRLTLEFTITSIYNHLIDEQYIILALPRKSPLGDLGVKKV
jgi:hypothetical protein